MKLIGRLKKDVESATSKTEANEILMNAGVELTPDELEYVTGGISTARPSQATDPSSNRTPSAHYKCKLCEKHFVSGSTIQCDRCGNNDLNKIELLYII